MHLFSLCSLSPLQLQCCSAAAPPSPDSIISAFQNTSRIRSMPGRAGSSSTNRTINRYSTLQHMLDTQEYWGLQQFKSNVANNCSQNMVKIFTDNPTWQMAEIWWNHKSCKRSIGFHNQGESTKHNPGWKHLISAFTFQTLLTMLNWRVA